MPDTRGYRQGELWRQPARRWVFHVDMDAFFASVEQLDNPALKGMPLIVGNSPLPMERLREMAAEFAARYPNTQPSASGQAPEFIKGIRGVVASASYEARAYGVRSAMPLARALALCPHAAVTHGRFDRYHEVAEQLRRIWADFSPLIEPMSVDEAYLDMTGIELSGGPIRAVGERLKARIREETGLTASVGIASSKLVAKVASDLQKPDGLVVVQHGEEAALLAPLPVRALQGIGPRAETVLHGLGIFRCGQIALANEAALALHFGPEHAASLIERARGIDDSPVEPPGDPKSVSRETTLADDTADVATLKSIMRGLADHVAWTLRQEGLSARCVYIKLRLLPSRRRWQPGGSGGGFGRLITRQTTLPMPSDLPTLIYGTAARLLDAAHRTTGLSKGSEVARLVGIGTANLTHTADLVGQFVAPAEGVRSEVAVAAPDGVERERRLTTSIDTIRKRYGFNSITNAASAPVKREMGQEELVDG